jgi:hypothetical protein
MANSRKGVLHRGMLPQDMATLPNDAQDTNNISLKYFETQPKASTKQLTWHDTLVLLQVELIHKLGQDNVILDVLSRKEEFQVEKPLINT